MAYRTNPVRSLPTVADYVRALTKLKPRLHKNHQRLLKHHFRSHKHTITATHLAKLLDYKSYRAVNLQYGRLGAKLGAALGSAYKPPKGAQASNSIASFIPPDAHHPDWEWCMHEPLAQALRELKWPLV